MFHDKPHMNIASQVLAGIILFVVFHTYLAKLRIQNALQYNAIAIEKMHLKHFQALLKKQEKSPHKDQKKSLDSP